MRCAVVLLMCVFGRACLGARIDELLHARCSAGCFDAPKKNKDKCETECNLQAVSKPGECPRPQERTQFENACISSCTQDRDCAGTDKCCPTDCGKMNCQSAKNLHQYPGLPGIPINVTISEARHSRSMLVRWALPSSPVTTGRVLYVIQERRHLGETLQPQLFGAWRARSRRRQTRVQLNGVIPAYWYQVRVAAVNSNGSQGFSLPSNAFTLNTAPNKPGEPRNLTVLRPGWVKGKLCAEIRWKRPSSDIPIHHYKVAWSYQDERDQSLVVNHKLVSYKSNNFILRGLKPQLLYFITVQAVTVSYGVKKKLRSDKAIVFINTRLYLGLNATYDWRSQLLSTVKNLHVTKFYRTNTNSLEAKIVWQAVKGSFLVKWSPASNCTSNEPSYYANTEASHYELDHLIYNCKYQVSVTAVSSNKSAQLSFLTPTCDQISSKLPCDS